MQDYTYFGPKKLEFLDQNNKNVKVPAFVSRAAKNYRFNHGTNKLEKKCIACKKYFVVNTYEEGKFFDSHNEEEIHFFSQKSGYGTRCKKCEDKIEKEVRNKEQEKETYEFRSNLTQENITYIRLVAVLENMSDEQSLNYLIGLLRTNNKITFNYDKKVK